jgi:two-component system, cell cycle sensor histidine kinase and response regulator CckA
MCYLTLDEQENLMGVQTHPTVLVVEDDDGIAELERARLEDSGYEVAVAGTAEDGFAVLSGRPIDLVLLDNRLPGGVDGLDFYARVKAAGLDPPVVLVTGFSDEGTAIRALRAGVRDFVTKSTEYLDYLPEAVGRVLAQVATERRLAESEARLAGVITSAQDAILVAEADFTISLFNPAAERMFRCKANQAVGQSLDQFILPNISAPIGDSGSPSLVGTRTRGLRATGEAFPLEATVARTKAAGRQFYTVVARDITERFRAEAALRESERRFRELADHAPILVWLAGPDGKCSYFNRVWLEFTGRKMAEELGDGWVAGIHSDDRTSCLQAYRAAVAARRPFTLEYRLRRADGNYRWILDTGVPRFTDSRAFVGFIGSGLDITDRKEMEEALRQSEERHRSFVETTNEWVWVCDPNGRMLYNNPALALMLGYPPEALERANTLDLLHPDDRRAAADQLARAAADRRGWSGVVFRWRHRDGSYRHLESNSVPTFGADGRITGFQGADRDITERLRLEADLRQAQKMEAIGRLAGGIAHDFNNLLTVINGFSELLLGSSTLDKDGQASVAEIARAGDQAAALTRQLLAFSRKQVLAPRVLDLNALVLEMEKMLARLIGADIELASNLDPALGRVRTDPGQIEQVLLNLAVNARDAMPHGGHLTIETKNVRLDPECYLMTPGLSAGPYVLLAVTDTGIGMTADVKSKIFEPFFTTKEHGKGTGLGLATVFGIVEQSGGHIDVYSEPGRGTIFKVYLPRLSDGGEPPSIADGWPAVPRGTETVLLADDDLGVRGLSRLALLSYGYTVLDATDGEEAIRIGLSHSGAIHLLVTDLVMPRAGGREVAERLATVHPEARLLFLSGYTDDALVRQGVLEAGVAFLQKPYTPTTLARKVREVLDAETASRWG